MPHQKICYFETVALTLGLFLLVTCPNPSSGAAFPLSVPSTNTNLTEIFGGLNLTNFLPGASPSVQQALGNLTQYLQSNLSSSLVQQALQNITIPGGNTNNLVQRLQRFLQNLRGNGNNNLTQNLTTAITNLSNFLSNSTNNNQLQQLINQFGSNNISNAVQNLQSQLSQFTLFLHTGLQNLFNQQPNVNLRNSITSLNNSITSGQLNTTMTQVLATLGSGQNLNLQQALSSIQNALKSGTNSGTNPFQATIAAIQNVIQNFGTQLQNFGFQFLGLFGNGTSGLGGTGTSSTNLFGFVGK